MTVNLHSTIDDEEYESGELLKGKFEKDAKLASPENQVHIITSVQCYGQETRDIDLVVFGSLKDYSTKVKCEVRHYGEDIKEREVKIDNFCVVIEVKEHDPERLHFDGTHLLVKYANRKIPHDATKQNLKQMYSLKNYLKADKLWISNLIFLPRAPKRPFEKEEISDEAVLFSDFDISDFWYKIFLQRQPIIFNSKINYSAMHSEIFEKELEKYLKKLTSKIKATRLDRKKIEEICRKQLRNQEYGDKLGDQLLIFRGRGGTGKTYRLLNLAWSIYDKYLARVLILTYNNALVADINRLLAIMRIPDGIDESIQIKSIYSFWYKVFYATGIRTHEEMEASYGYSDFQEYKEQLSNYLEKSKNNLSRLSIEYPDLFSWDYVMIDEAQDWPKDERDLIYKLFAPNKIIIADDIDQLIRNPFPCNWHVSTLVKEKQVVYLRKSLRQKSNLTRFIKEIMEKLEFYNWDIEDNEKSYGGKVIIVEGNYSKEFHENLMQQNKDDKNENIDMLFCVPPKNVNKDTDRSILGDGLANWGYLVWDGTGEKIRKSYPTNINQFRIVQYDSSRGLEGWICVNIAFDKFYEYKLDIYKTPKEGQSDFKSPEDRRKEFAARWLLIPLTRAMDTLVLHVEDPNSHISRILKEIYSNNPEYIKWVSE